MHNICLIHKIVNKFVSYSTTDMGKLLVHLHLYYHDQTDYFMDKLSNITVPFKLIVTMTDENGEIRNRILSEYPDAQVIIVENAGYDVYPFFQAMKQVDLSQYEYILKLHTKNQRKKLHVNHLHFRGYGFRDNLILPLVGSKKNFDIALDSITSSDKVGIVCPRFFLLKKEAPANRPMTERLCNEYGIPFSSDVPFCSGTMFLCRREIIQFLLKNNYTADDYGRQLKTGNVGSLAHSMETMFGIACDHLGYHVKGIDGSSLYYTLVLYYKTIFHKDVRWLLAQ